MLFECKASFSYPNVTARPGRAKIGLGGKNGTHYILIGFSTSKEKLSVQSVDKVLLSKNRRTVTITFSRPQKILTVEAHESGDNLMSQFARTVMSLKKGDDKELAKAIPPIDESNWFKLQPKTLNVEGGSYDIRLLANNRLESVSFTGTKLLPKGIWRLEFLTELHLTNCDLREFPDRLCKLSQMLAILDLSNNKISKIDPRLAILFKNLKQLNLSRNEIRVIPVELVFIKTLLHFDISRNHVKKIPFTIGLMKSLKQLNLSHNRLDHFPESIVRPLTNSAKLLLRLENFDLSGNEVTEADLQSGPGRSFCRSESWQRLRDQYPDQVESHLSPPSLFEISARSVLKCTKAYRVLHCWLPRTVYEFLQENAALCSRCTAACVAYRSELVPGPGHFSLLANTIQSDAATTRIPIVRFICWHCDLTGKSADSLRNA